MHAAGYRLADFGRFLLKRIVRIDPPYLAAIALILIQAWLIAAAGVGRPSDFSAVQVLLHLGYLNAFAGYSWLNPVFWTLAIEFQYYLAIALLFPLIATARIGRHALVFAIFAVAAWLLPGQAFVCHYLFLFLFGIVTFQFRNGLLTRPAYFAALAVSALGTALTLEWIVAAVGLAYFSSSWIVWTTLMIGMLFLFGRHHPRTFDENEPLDRQRMVLALVAVIILIICFTPAPIEPLDLIER